MNLLDLDLPTDCLELQQQALETHPESRISQSNSVTKIKFDAMNVNLEQQTVVRVDYRFSLF
jgi:hypothetical protein